MEPGNAASLRGVVEWEKFKREQEREREREREGKDAGSFWSSPRLAVSQKSSRVAPSHPSRLSWATALQSTYAKSNLTSGRPSAGSFTTFITFYRHRALRELVRPFFNSLWIEQRRALPWRDYIKLVTLTK